jgi:hypothetical protein
MKTWKERYTYGKVFIGIIPSFKESVPDREGSSLVGTEILKIKSGKTKGILNVINYWSLDWFLIGPDVRTHKFPYLFIASLSLLVLELRL